MKKRADNRYQKTVRFKDPSGRSARKVIYGRTQNELNAKVADFRAQIALGQRIDAGDCTVAEWAEEWRSTYKDNDVSAKTLEGYKRDLRLITDAIGYMPIRQVRHADLQRILSSRAGMSGSAIRKTAMTIRALFKAAAVNRMIPYSPAEGLKLPNQKDGTHRALTQQEIDRITAAVHALMIETRKPHRFALPVMLMLYGGLRRGEVAAFHVEQDANLNAGTITISRSVSYTTNTPVIKQPKSSAGTRTLPIFPPLRPFLEGATGYAAVPSASSQARNKARQGQPITRQAFNHAFNEFMAMADVKCTPHDLRHTWFTIIYDAGVDVKTAQRWGGHATAAVTMEIYTHLSHARETASMDLVNAYFGTKDSQSDSQ